MAGRAGLEEAYCSGMSGTLYPAARALAARLAEHFARHARPSAPSAAAGPRPDAATIEALVDAAFWASLQREEGSAPEISLAFPPPELAAHPLLFAPGLPALFRAATEEEAAIFEACAPSAVRGDLAALDRGGALDELLRVGALERDVDG